jgi:type I restriction enzyme S subunit
MLSPKAKTGKTAFPYLRNVNVQWGRIDLSNLVEMDFDGREREKFSLRRGDLIVCEGGEPGRCAVVDRDLTGVYFQKALMRVRPRDGSLDTRFLLRFMEFAAQRGTFIKDGNQATIAHFPAVKLNALEVPLPPLPEQRRIADVLEKADAIRRKRKEAIALTEELLRSAFLEMFGDPVANPKGWPTETIDDLCSRGAGLVDGPFGSSLKPEHYVPSGVKVVRNWNIYDDRFDFSEFKHVTPAKFEDLRRSEVLSGDVLITTKGTVGDVCVAPDLGGPAVLSASGTVRLRVPPDESYLPEFVVGQMTTQRYKRYLHTFEAGSAQQYLNLSAIRKMRLIRPPKKEQVVFRAFRARVRESQRDMIDADNQVEGLFSSLVAWAFSGGLSS